MATVIAIYCIASAVSLPVVLAVLMNKIKKLQKRNLELQKGGVEQ